jgi:hypothetical protein
MREIWSRRAGLNRQPADYEKPFKDNKLNAFNKIHVQQEAECGIMVTPFTPYSHPGILCVSHITGWMRISNVIWPRTACVARQEWAREYIPPPHWT